MEAAFAPTAGSANQRKVKAVSHGINMLKRVNMSAGVLNEYNTFSIVQTLKGEKQKRPPVLL